MGQHSKSSIPRSRFVRGSSCSITNDGSGEASISGTLGGGDLVIISAGVGDVVSLRGLVIDGHFVGADGIIIQQASAVHIQNCVIRNFQFNFAGNGISLQSNGNGQLFVSDTVIYNNGSTANSGTGIRADGPRATILLNDNTITRNGTGIGAVNGGQLIS